MIKLITIKQNRLLNTIILVIAAGFLITSCYPDKTEDIADLDIVQTQYDMDFDFTARSYYLLPDTIPVMSESDSYEKS